MEYKRLTKCGGIGRFVNDDCITCKQHKDDKTGCDFCCGSEHSKNWCCGVMYDRLAELEDKIENGTLIELPCKAGDTVWFVYETDNETMFIDKGVIQSFSYDEQGVWFRAIYENLSSYWHTALSIGETVFLTKAEAEQRLKELEDE